MPESFLKRQIIPVSLTFIICAILVFLLWIEILVLNHFTHTPISLSLRPFDILVGLTIYLKTSIDFAIFIGNLMRENSGWRSRIAIEIGTALGNGLGTMGILIAWSFFKEIEWLLAGMIFIASLVLFRLAEESLEHAKAEDNRFPNWFKKTVSSLEYGLDRINHVIAPILKYIVPNLKMNTKHSIGFWTLFISSFTIPFILGLDDFAGYVALFSVVNVFGFAIGVFLGHMVLNMLLYLSPERTIRFVKNPIISFLGSLAFIGIALWGFYEVVKIFFH